MECESNEEGDASECESRGTSLYRTTPSHANSTVPRSVLTIPNPKRGGISSGTGNMQAQREQTLVVYRHQNHRCCRRA